MALAANCTESPKQILLSDKVITTFVGIGLTVIKTESIAAQPLYVPPELSVATTL
mgnify:CR=1 FL=1